MGLSPLETLRRILAEEAAAGDHREGVLAQCGAGIDGVVDTADDGAEALHRHRRRPTGASSGRRCTPAARRPARPCSSQEGETFKPRSFSAKDSEYTVGGKLRREDLRRGVSHPAADRRHPRARHLQQHQRAAQASLSGLPRAVARDDRAGDRSGSCWSSARTRPTSTSSSTSTRSWPAASKSRRSRCSCRSASRGMTVNEGARAARTCRATTTPRPTASPRSRAGPSDATAHPTGRTTRCAAPDDDEDDDEDDDADAHSRPWSSTRPGCGSRPSSASSPSPSARPRSSPHLDRWNRELDGRPDAASSARSARRAAPTGPTPPRSPRCIERGGRMKPERYAHVLSFALSHPWAIRRR